MGEKQKKRWKKRLLVAIALVVAAAVFLHVPVGRVKIKVSPETTFVEGPLNPDGTVNYVAALDGLFADGVTAENNAAPDLLRVFGLSILRPPEIREEVLGRLGLGSEDVGDGIFIPWGDRTVQTSREAAQTQPAFTKPDGSVITLDEAGSLDTWEMLREGRVHPDLDGWLRENADALRLIQQTVAAKPRFYMPLVSMSKPPTVISILLCSTWSCRDAATALASRALWRSRQGNRDEAWTDVLTAHRLARLPAQSPILIDQLAAMGMDRVAAETGVILATQGPMDSQEAKRLLAALKGLRPFRPVAEIIDREERFMKLDGIMMMSRGQSLGDGEDIQGQRKPDLDWNEMLRHANAWHDRMAEPHRTPRFEGRAEAEDRFADQVGELNAHLASKGFRVRMAVFRLGGWPFRRALSREIANVLIGVLLPTLGRANDLQDQAIMAHAVETTAVGLACFKADKGRWPSSLIELSPAYLKEVPRDFFSQGALVYRASGRGYVLYSVGMNQRDDGGVQDLQRDKDDIVARVGPPRPAEGAATTTASAPASR